MKSINIAGAVLALWMLAIIGVMLVQLF